jgi:hypothetical protein
MRTGKKKDVNSDEPEPIDPVVQNNMGLTATDAKGEIKPGPFRAAERLLRRCEGKLLNTVCSHAFIGLVYVHPEFD